MSGVGEDARHALPQQLVSVDLSSSGCLLLLSAMLCDPKPPSTQHLQQIHKTTSGPREHQFYNSVLSFAAGEGCVGECYLGLKREGPVPERPLRLLSFSPSVLQLFAGRKPKSRPVELNQTTYIGLAV